MTQVDWLNIFDQIWNGLTLKQACAYLEMDYGKVQDYMSPAIRYFIIDVSMVVNARADLISELIIEGELR